MAQLHTKVIQAKTLKSPLAQVIGLFISLTLSWSDSPILYKRLNHPSSYIGYVIPS